MTYIKVLWLHNDKDYPIEIYSELDDERYEMRKLEIFIDGSAGYATSNSSYGKTMLAEIPIPFLKNINEDSQFKAENIAKDTFCKIWNKYVVV